MHYVLKAMTSNKLIVVSCGVKKQTTAQRADKMYLGNYHFNCLNYARSIAEPEDIRILSAKYGLLRLNQIVMPYNLTMGDPGCITVEQLKQQAVEQNLTSKTDVRIVAGLAYAKLVLGVWTEAEWLMKDKGRMGYQKNWLITQTKLNRSKQHE